MDQQDVCMSRTPLLFLVSTDGCIPTCGTEVHQYNLAVHVAWYWLAEC
jgi:hypothetical protein